MQNLVVLFFCFRPETPFLGKFGPKNQNCQFKLKFGTKTNSNMQNSMALFTFSVLDRKYPFLDKFGPKNQNCQFKLKFGTKPNSNMHNSMALFIFCFGPGTPLLGKFGPKSKNCQLKMEVST